MDNRVEKVATFHSHYGAMVFKKRVGESCRLAPVPRSLSSSCGTAAFFSSNIDSSLIDENVEAIYLLEQGKYKKIYGEEERY